MNQVFVERVGRSVPHWNVHEVHLPSLRIIYDPISEGKERSF